MLVGESVACHSYIYIYPFFISQLKEIVFNTQLFRYIFKMNSIYIFIIHTNTTSFTIILKLQLKVSLVKYISFSYYYFFLYSSADIQNIKMCIYRKRKWGQPNAKIISLKNSVYYYKMRDDMIWLLLWELA